MGAIPQLRCRKLWTKTQEACSTDMVTLNDNRLSVIGHIQTVGVREDSHMGEALEHVTPHPLSGQDFLFLNQLGGN